MIADINAFNNECMQRQLEHTLADIAAGAAPEPHFVQLYWLLTSYFSACAEVGAYAYVVCQE